MSMLNTYKNRMPSQNSGRQQQTLAVVVTNVSAAVPRRTALMMPNTMPSGTLIKNASSERKIVTGSRSEITSITGR